MDEIPLPSSPDSPGPPGEENHEKRAMNKILQNRESTRLVSMSPTPPLATSFGETYSPSMVTSSPEYTPGTDDNSNASISTSKKYKGYLKFLRHMLRVLHF